MARPFKRRAGPVPVDAPQGSVQFVDPKTGNLTPHALKLLSLLWERSGAYDDDVWAALGVGRAGLTQIGQVSQSVSEIEAAAAALNGAIATLRGDPRLEEATKALSLAVVALVQAVARSNGELERRVGDLDKLVASLGARATKTTQTLALNVETLRRESVSAQIQQVALTQEQLASMRQLAKELGDASESFDGRVRNSISATGSISYNSSTGRFSYTQPSNVSAFSNDVGYLTSAAIGVSVQGYSANLSAFAGKTAPAGAVVGTSDPQTLSSKTLDTLRTQDTATAASVAQTHHIPINVNGTTFKLLLAS